MVTALKWTLKTEYFASRNIISKITSDTDLSEGEPYQCRGPDDDPIPGEGRESIAGDDRKEGLDDDPGDDERDERPDADQHQVVPGDRVAMLEELERRCTAQRRRRCDEAAYGRWLAVAAQTHTAPNRP